MPRAKPNPDLNDEIETEFVQRASNAARPPPKSARDRSLVKVLVLVKNVPVGVVLDPIVDEEGGAVLDDEGRPREAIVERRLAFKERVQMERWCADIMAEREHVEIL